MSSFLWNPVFITCRVRVQRSQWITGIVDDKPLDLITSLLTWKRHAEQIYTLSGWHSRLSTIHSNDRSFPPEAVTGWAERNSQEGRHTEEKTRQQRGRSRGEGGRGGMSQEPPEEEEEEEEEGERRQTLTFSNQQLWEYEAEMLEAAEQFKHSACWEGKTAESLYGRENVKREEESPSVHTDTITHQTQTREALISPVFADEAFPLYKCHHVLISVSSWVSGTDGSG